MKRNKLDYAFSKLKALFQRPEQINSFAVERVEAVANMLKEKEKYHCPTDCRLCCYGAILMSYTEFTSIMLYLQNNWRAEQTQELFRERVGLMQNEQSLLCPFLQEEAVARHCLIYPARPLICRVFGTTASPCAEDITASVLEEELFYQAYNLLYYAHNQFIALSLDEEWALFEAPFAFWCLADSEPESRRFLRFLVAEKGESFKAVFYHQRDKIFFTYSDGRQINLHSLENR